MAELDQVRPPGPVIHDERLIRRRRPDGRNERRNAPSKTPQPTRAERVRDPKHVDEYA